MIGIKSKRKGATKGLTSVFQGITIALAMLAVLIVVISYIFQALPIASTDPLYSLVDWVKTTLTPNVIKILGMLLVIAAIFLIIDIIRSRGSGGTGTSGGIV